MESDLGDLEPRRSLAQQLETADISAKATKHLTD